MSEFHAFCHKDRVRLTYRAVKNQVQLHTVMKFQPSNKKNQVTHIHTSQNKYKIQIVC